MAFFFIIFLGMRETYKFGPVTVRGGFKATNAEIKKQFGKYLSDAELKAFQKHVNPPKPRKKKT